jgi:5-methylcytosine-specific restriction protein A
MRRLEFSAQTKRQAFARSAGICECHRIPWLKRPDGCDVALVAGGIFYEHITPDAIRPDNSIENCAVLSRTCWRKKTARFDVPTIAKSNHIRDRHIGAVATPQQVIVGSRASGWKNHMRGGWSCR